MKLWRNLINPSIKSFASNDGSLSGSGSGAMALGFLTASEAYAVFSYRVFYSAKPSSEVSTSVMPRIGPGILTYEIWSNSAELFRLLRSNYERALC